MARRLAGSYDDHRDSAYRDSRSAQGLVMLARKRMEGGKCALAMSAANTAQRRIGAAYAHAAHSRAADFQASVDAEVGRFYNAFAYRCLR